MRVMLITPSYYPVIAATSYLYQELCQSLVSMGHEVDVVTGFPRINVRSMPEEYKYRLWTREVIDGVNVLRIRMITLPRYVPVARGLEYLGVGMALFLRALFHRRPEVALVHPPALFEGLGAVVLRALKNVPFILNVHDLFPHTAVDLGLLKNKFLINFFERLEAYLYKTSDWVSVHSEGNREFVIGRGAHPERTIVMPVWMDASQLIPGPRVNSWRTKQGLADKFVIVFAGTQGYNQDMDVILKAAGLLRQIDDIQFAIIGDGAQHDAMVDQSKQMGLSNVRWLDWQPREDFSMIMHSSDIVIATLKKEVSTPVVPSKILSAMSTGRPVLVAMPLSGDAPKLVVEAEAGLAIPPGDEVRFAEAVIMLYKDRALGERFGANGRAYIEQHLDVNRWAKEYIKLFSQLIGEKETS